MTVSIPSAWYFSTVAQPHVIIYHHTRKFTRNAVTIARVISYGGSRAQMLLMAACNPTRREAVKSWAARLKPIRLPWAKGSRVGLRRDHCSL